MKTPTFRHIASIACMALAAGTICAQADSGTYTNENAVGLWSDTANWFNGIVADGAGNMATFGNSGAAAETVNMDSSRTIGNLEFLLGNYTIDNNTNDANVLTLAGATTPVITSDPSTVNTLRNVVIAGSDGLVIDGGGELDFWKDSAAPANTFTGGIIITNNSTLQINSTDLGNVDNPANVLALSGVGPITLANGTLNLRPPQHTSAGYGQVDNDLIVPTGMTGTIFLPVRWSGASGDNNANPGNGLGGTLTGGGTLNVNIRYVRGAIVGDWSAFTGQINVQHDAVTDGGFHEFRLGNPAGLPNAYVDFVGTLNFNLHYYRQLTSDTVFPIGALSGENTLAGLVGGDTAAFTLFFDIGAMRTDPASVDTFVGPITDGGGPAGLIKSGAGTFVLAGPNTYTGPTVINGGVLQIGDGTETVTMGATPITNNSVLVINRTGTMTLSGLITGAGSITNVGDGVVTLGGTNNYTGPTYINAGKLVVSTVSQSPTMYTVADGAGLGIRVAAPNTKLTAMNSVTFGSGCTFDVDFYQYGAMAGTPLATNMGTIAFNGSDVPVNILGTNFTTGTITLLTYANRTGVGSFTLNSLPPNITAATLTDDTVNHELRLNITSVYVPPDYTIRYVGDASGIWDINNTGNKIWQELLSGQATNFYDGAPVRFDDSATGTPTVTLAQSVDPLRTTVSNSVINYTITESTPGSGIGITDSSGAPGKLIKQGDGKLTLSSSGNIYTGPTIIQGGTLEIGDGQNNGSIGTGDITNNATLLFNSGGADTFGLGLTLANPIHGTGSVVVANTNFLSLPNTISGNNDYSGGLFVLPNVPVTLSSSTAAGTGGLTVEGGTVTLSADIAGSVGSVTVVSNGTFIASSNRRIDAPMMATNATITFDKTAIITLYAEMNGIVGTIINTNTGLLRFNAGGANSCTGSSNALWVLADPGGWVQPRNNSDNYMGALEGVGVISAQQSGGSGTATWHIGGLDTDSVFQGVINDGASFSQLGRFTAIDKVGTGTLVLSNATLSYRGTTRVGSGTLALKGSSLPTESTNITVAAPGMLDVSGRDDGTLTLGIGSTNQTLMGDGTINGDLSLGSSALLEPGLSIGTLTVSGTATIGGVTTMELDGSSTASDRLVANTINYGGTLVLTNTGGSVVGTHVYQLFSGTLNGSFSTVVTQAIAGVTWDLSALNSSGQVSLVGPTVNTTPTNIVLTASGNQLTLHWPDDHKGWTLFTNASGIADSGAWFPYPGSDATNEVVVTYDPAKTNVFFQLRLNP